GPVARSRRRVLVRILLQILSLAAVAFFFWRERHEFLGFGNTMGRLSWFWVGMSVAAELASIPPLAEAQRLVLRAGRTSAPRGQMILVTLASNAISLSVPAGIAVAVGYTFTRFRKFGASAAVAAWAELAS